ncbi:histidine kinase [Bernardetia sp. ABR2-2B]|uniref:sensor histidine kinase n=1 Tax=Bernardetia sp. ABR2-2B TaxID=3127472 RepID=UPI0030D36215
MNTQKIHNTLKNRSLTYKNTYVHIFFWFAYTLFWGIVGYESTAPIWQLLLTNFFFLIGHAGASYVGIYILLPRFFQTKKYVSLVVFSLLTIFLFSFLISVGMTLSFFLNGESYSEIWLPRKWFPKFFLSTFWISAIFMAWKALKDWRKADKRNSQLEKENLQSEVHFLKAQLNPHFLFNALNSIYFQVNKSQEEAQESILTFSEMLRYQLYDCAIERVELRQEIEYLKNYLSMESLRKGDRVCIKTDFDVENQSVLISPLLFLPLVENACKWVSMEKEENNFITIILKIKDNILFFSVENSRSEQILPTQNKGGIGQQNLARRLELLYPKKHRLSFQQNPQTYIAVLELDLNESLRLQK